MAKKKQSADSKRGYAFSFIVYPDNEDQMKLFRFLQESRCPYNCRMIWIKHDPESDDKKEHIHCLIKFDLQKTVAGVRKMFGQLLDVWRLYTITDDEFYDDLKYKAGEVERFRKIIPKVTPVLTIPDQPDSFIEIPYDEKHMYNPQQCMDKVPCLDSQAYLRTKVYVIQHVEVCTDCNAYALYMLHANYDSVIHNKKRYSIDELHGDLEFMQSCFPELKEMDELSIVSNILKLTRGVCQGLISNRDVICELVETGDKETYEYIKNHSSFVRDWILEDWKKTPNDF